MGLARGANRLGSLSPLGSGPAFRRLARISCFFHCSDQSAARTLPPLFTFQTAPPSLKLRRASHQVRHSPWRRRTPPPSRGAFFAPGSLLLCFAHPIEGWAERRETFGCLRDTRWARSNVACQALARRLASHDAGRSPPRRSTVAVLGSGSALPSAALAPDWLQRACSQPGPPGMRGPGPLPGQAVTSRRRRTPLLAPPSGSSLEDAPR